ncbi:hypothetical protein [Candidatus Nitrotoga fabula]|uniref:Uncharacterized protein n=1 Tax=Candidatus Nitrotoga fabula TaxID=2182327 RepID=A0A916FBG2_9PROT|nr:hypothetical protein [Candidatus Nitrotoga fabula]CAE6727749.1 hypothetical protein NTGZN8_370010 [Candidatus Nitrotoga fabula]
MTGFESLTLALEDWFDKPLSDLPDGLRERFKNQLLSLLWDSLSANQRRSAALQLDYEMDPARTEERDATWNEVSVDWDYWKQVPKLTAQEFCILCLLQDPRHFESEKTFTFGGAGKTLGERVGDDVRIIERTLGPDITRPIPEWIAWAKLQNWDMPSYFRDYEKNGGTFIAPQDLTGTNDPKLAGNRCAVFRTMEKLTADEVSMTFVGDKNQSGMGNNMLEISARGVTRRVALAELELVDRRKGHLNRQGVILLGMAQNKKLSSNQANIKKISRLRAVFFAHLGISNDPFMAYREGTGWEPLFNIKDLRGAADDRARKEGERKSISLDELTGSGHQLSDTNESNNPDNDSADAWLKKNDPSYPSEY